MTRKQKKLRLKYGGPVRTCIVCRRRQAGKELLRLVLTVSGLQFDPGQTAPGRGYYLCHRPECLAALLSGRRRIPRLPAGVGLLPESREALEARVDRSRMAGGKYRQDRQIENK